MPTYCYNCMKPIEAGTAVCPHCRQSTRMDAPAHQLRPGTFLRNRYVVGRVLGQGGFGITYIGRDTVLNMRVAVKEFYPNGIAYRDHHVNEFITITDSGQGFFQSEKQKFLLEAQTLARFYSEPGIVSVHDYFEANNTAYIVMEYLDGITLKSYVLARGKIPTDVVFRVMRPLIHTLEKVHAQEVIHRDISPDNIMVLQNGSLKLLDFGAAREVDREKSLSVMLKPGYAPEEQYRRKGMQGPWTDVYALCATMYFCVTGERPEEAPDRVWKDEVKRPAELGAAITPPQEGVLLRGMAIRTEDRYQSMQELREAIDKVSTVLAQGEQTLYTDTRIHVTEQTNTVEEKAGGQQTYTAGEDKKDGPPDHDTDNDTDHRKRPYWLFVLLAALCIGLFFGLKNLDISISKKEAPTPLPQAVEEKAEDIAAEEAGVAEADNTPAETDSVSPEADALYEQGKASYEKKDYAAALSAFQEAAEAGSVDAMNRIGSMYRMGYGVKRDYEQAMAWYTRALERGSIDAMTNFGIMYRMGYGVEQDYDTAREYFLRAVNGGSTSAMNNLGYMYTYGNGVEKNGEKALEWFNKSLELGDTSAAQGIGSVYAECYYDYDEALEWYNKALDAGSESAALNIGNLYEYKLQDYEKALEWYTTAAEEGDGNAMISIGQMYTYGHGVTENYDEALAWYNKALDAGVDRARSNIAALYYRQNDYDKALQAYLELADEGDGSAMDMVGLIYQYGDGVTQNYEKAMEWYLKAVDIGYTYAMCSIGDLYKNGYGVEKNIEKAMEWYLKAVDAGETSAMTTIAMVYYYGNGVEKDYAKALEWYRKAADAGSSFAMYEVAEMIENGEGTQADPELAQEWYRKAATVGFDSAKEKIR